MTLARPLSSTPSPKPQPDDARSHSDLASRLAGSMAEQAATLSTLDGRYITGGIAEFTGNPLQWGATLRHLDRPGVVASMFFAEGVRDVIMKLEDGRQGKARLTSTSFIASAQRVCQLAGSERLQ